MKRVKEYLIVIVPLFLLITFMLPARYHSLTFGSDDIGRSIDFLIFNGYIDLIKLSFVVTIVSAIFGIVSVYVSVWCMGVKDVFEGIKNVVFGLPPLLTALILMKLFFEEVETRRVGFFLISLSFAWMMAHEGLEGRFSDLYHSTMVKASTAMGVSKFGILFRHIIPNSVENILTVLFDNFRFAFTLYLTIGFLGFGIPDSLGDLIGTNFLSAVGYFNYKSVLLLVFSPFLPFFHFVKAYLYEIPGKVVFIAISYVIWTVVFIRVLRVGLIRVIRSYIR